MNINWYFGNYYYLGNDFLIFELLVYLFVFCLLK